MNMAVSGDGVVVANSNTFSFSVQDPAVVESINVKLRTGQRAILHYEQMISSFPCRRDTSYVITQVE